MLLVGVGGVGGGRVVFEGCVDYQDEGCGDDAWVWMTNGCG